MTNKTKVGNVGNKIIIAVFIIILILSIVVTEIESANRRRIENIDMARYIKEYSSQGESLILLSNDDCSECSKISKVLEEIKVKEEMEIYNLNVDRLSKEDTNTLLTSSDFIDLEKLPMLLHVSAGAVIGSYAANTNYDDTMSFASILKNITVDEYINLVKGSDEYFIYIGRPTCGYCVQSVPWTKRVSYELDKDIYYINIDEETKSSLSTLAEATDEIYRGSTPLFLIVKNGKVVDYKEGAGSYDDLSTFFKQTNQK